MTRSEFIDDVTSWSELIYFCYNQRIGYCDDVYSDDAKDDYYNDDIVDMARNAGDWRELLSTLEDIPTGYDYYIRDDYGEFRGADDDDFEEIKRDVIDYMDEGDYWDEDDEDDEEEEYFEPNVEDDAEPDVEDEDVSFGELFAACNGQLHDIHIAAEIAKKEEDAKLEALFTTTVEFSISGGNA